MKAKAEKINLEDYILSVLSPEDRLNASFAISKETFKSKVVIDTGILIYRLPLVGFQRKI